MTKTGSQTIIHVG